MQRRSVLQLAFAVAVPGWPLAMAARAESDAVVRRRLRFNLTFTNPHQHDLTDQQFACYLPAQLDAAQLLHRIDVSMPHKIETDALGHRVLLLPFERVAGLSQKIVALTVEVDCLAPAPLLPEAALTTRAQWLGPERFIEADAQVIRTLAASLKSSGELQTARQIYDWVRTNLTYAGYVANDRGALDALESRRADCTDYAYLVVALARANGIAARMVGGYVVDRDVAPRSEEYHNWAELYMHGAWRMVDAQKENWLASTAQYIVFRICREAITNSVGLAHRYQMRGQLLVKL